MNKDLLTTREAAAILGVGTTSIKRWADSGLLKCVKTPGGHRRFPRVAVDALVRLEQPLPASEPDDRLGRWFEVLLDADAEPRTLELLTAGRARVDAWWVVCDEIADIIHELGRRWARGEVTVIQEHIASERLARALATVCRAIPLRPGAPVCLLATAEGDEHTLGLSMAEPCLREAGWYTAWAGRKTPVHQICDHVHRGRADMVAMSASQFSQDLPDLADQAQRLSAACRERGIPLVLGGLGAWPDPPSYGYRITRFKELHDLLATMESSRPAAAQNSPD